MSRVFYQYVKNPNLHSAVKTISSGARKISLKNEQNEDSDGGWEESRARVAKLKAAAQRCSSNERQ